MAKDAHNKPIIIEVPNPDDGKQPRFNRGQFEKAIGASGYECDVEKAVRCPCKPLAVKTALPNCENCGGVGWFFVDKKRTFALIQAMNRKTKFINWSEQDRGTSMITTIGGDKLAFMDRFTILELEASFSQQVRISEFKGGLHGFLFYEPLVVDEIFLFESSSKPLIALDDTQYTITENVIRITDLALNTHLKSTEDGKQLSITIRFTHNPVHHIIDIPRELVRLKQSDRDCDNFIKDKQYFPIHAIGRRAHYMFDAPDLSGEGLFNNTVEPPLVPQP